MMIYYNPVALQKYNQSGANICFDCEKACGGCSWSAFDPETDKVRFEPVPGWTAEKTLLRGGHSGQYFETYHITACPEYVQEKPKLVSSMSISDEKFAELIEQWKLMG